MSARKPEEIWVTFAVPEEAGPFRRRAKNLPGARIILTGMGAANARRTMQAALAETRPAVVLSSGFAGGLNPALARGTVLFAAAAGSPWSARLAAAGAVAGRFHQSERIAVTPAEKAALRERTGADAVEMESGAIREVCAAHDVPCVVARVISDAADEALPLDFNALLTPDHRLRYGRLAWRLLRSPRTIPELLRFQRRVHAAAEHLAVILRSALRAE
jgi:nucleoside phosphorylase